MHRLLAERVRYLRGIPPENPALKQSVAQVAERVQQVEEQADQMRAPAQEYIQQTATSANAMQSDLNSLGQQAATNPSQTRQGETDQTKPLWQTRPKS